VLFVPFNEDLAARVREKGNLVEARSLPLIGLSVKRTVTWCRPSKIHYIPKAICGFCGHKFKEPLMWKWSQDSGTVTIEESTMCPVCFATNHWYCDQCDSFKDTAVLVNGNVVCPDCPERGMMQVCQLVDIWEEKHSYVNVLDIDGNRHIILDLVRT
jgi:hypothetical protein